MAAFSRLLLQSAELRLAGLPRPCVLHLPGGETLDPRGDKILRAYRLYLAGSAMSFEQGWLSLFQILGAHLDGVIEPDAQLPPTMRTRQCAYPFERRYMQVPHGN